MPLKKGKSRAVKKRNFHEFRRGKTFARTERKEGKAAAERQMEAVVLSTARRSSSSKPRVTRSDAPRSRRR